MFPILSAYTGCLIPIRADETPKAISGSQIAALVGDVFFEALVIALGIVTILASIGVHVGPFNALSQFGILGGQMIIVFAAIAITLELILLMVLMCKHISRLHTYKKSLEISKPERENSINPNSRGVKIEELTNLQKELQKAKDDYTKLKATTIAKEEHEAIVKSVTENVREFEIETAGVNHSENQRAENEKLKQKLKEKESQLQALERQKTEEIENLNKQMNDEKTASGRLSRKSQATTRILNEELKVEKNRSTEMKIEHEVEKSELNEELENQKKLRKQRSLDLATLNTQFTFVQKELSEKKVALETLSRSKQELVDKIEALDKKSEELQKQKSEEVEDLKLKLQEKENNLSQLTQSEKNLQDKIDELNRDLQLAEIKIDLERSARKDQIDSLNSKLENERNQLNEMTKSKEELEAKVDDLNTKLLSASSELEIQNASSILQITILQSDLEKKDAELKELRHRESEIQSDLSKELPNLESKKNELQQIKESEDALITKTTELSTSLQRVRSDTEDKEKTIVALKKELEATKEKLEKLTRSEIEFKSKIEDLECKLKEAKESSEKIKLEHNVKINSLNAEIQTQQSDLLKLQKSENDLNALMAELNLTLGRVQLEANTLKTESERKLHSLKQELKNKSSKIEELQASERELKLEIEQLTQLSSFTNVTESVLKEENESLRKEKEQLLNELQELKSKLANTHEAHEKESEMIDSLIKDQRVEDLQNENTKLKTQLNDEKAKLELFIKNTLETNQRFASDKENFTAENQKLKLEIEELKKKIKKLEAEQFTLIEQ